jgi:hypothetical protein
MPGVYITQDPSEDSLEDSFVDAEGLPQLPLSNLARTLRDMTAPNFVKVKSHYRRRKYPAKKKNKVKSSQQKIDGWLRPTKVAHGVNKNSPKQTESDRTLAFSLHLLEVRELISGVNHSNNSTTKP